MTTTDRPLNANLAFYASKLYFKDNQKPLPSIILQALLTLLSDSVAMPGKQLAHPTTCIEWTTYKRERMERQFTTPSVVNFSPYKSNPCKKGSTILRIAYGIAIHSTSTYFVIKVLNYLLHKYTNYM